MLAAIRTPTEPHTASDSRRSCAGLVTSVPQPGATELTATSHFSNAEYLAFTEKVRAASAIRLAKHRQTGECEGEQDGAPTDPDNSDDSAED